MTSTCRGGAGQIDRCPLDAAVVEVWTRDDSLSLQGVRRLKRVVAGSCFNTNSLSPVLSGQGLSVGFFGFFVRLVVSNPLSH